jgi:hypothetical protein
MQDDPVFCSSSCCCKSSCEAFHNRADFEGSRDLLLPVLARAAGMLVYRDAMLVPCAALYNNIDWKQYAF